MSLVIEKARGPFCTLRQATITREYCRYVCPHTLCPIKTKRETVIDHIILHESPPESSAPNSELMTARTPLLPREADIVGEGDRAPVPQNDPHPHR